MAAVIVYGEGVPSRPGKMPRRYVPAAADEGSITNTCGWSAPPVNVCATGPFGPINGPSTSPPLAGLIVMVTAASPDVTRNQNQSALSASGDAAFEPTTPWQIET